MSRLFDRLALMPELPEWDVERPPIVIDASNVADYYYAGTDQEYWEKAYDFPAVVPPFISCFIEWKTPARSRSCEVGDRKIPLASRVTVGTYLQVGWDSKWEATSRQGQVGGYNKRATATLAAPSIRDAFGTLLNSEGIRWGVFTVQYVESARGVWLGTRLFNILLITPQGTIYEYPDKTVGIVFVEMPEVHEYVSVVPGVTMDILRQVSHHYLDPTLLTLSFMNCKNVAQRIINPPPRLNKKYIKRRGRSLVSYRVLEIDPMKQVLRTEGRAGAVGLQRALHICRGHFKTYDEKPLFGRLKGTFWWPQTLRGSANQGVVLKDYAVKAPLEEKGS